MPKPSQALAVPVQLPPPTAEELEQMTIDERRAETFLLYSTGWEQTRIARRFNVSQTTVSKDIAIEIRKRRARAENIDEEIERVAGVYENVMTRAWNRHNEAADVNITSVAGTNYLRLVLDAAEKYAQLRGLDASSGVRKTEKSQTRVVVRIGGSSESPQIDVGVES